MPRWPFDKFDDADRFLGTQMKATGEVMSIDENLEGALMKAARSLEQGLIGLSLKSLSDLSIGIIKQKITKATDERLFAIAEGFRRGIGINEMQSLSKIHSIFLEKIKNIVQMEKKLKKDVLTPQLVERAKIMQFPDTLIAELSGKTETEIANLREKHHIQPKYML